MFRRRRFRRRGFSRKPVARKQPTWIANAFNVTLPPQVTVQSLFQLVGPEDYTPDYVSEPQRLDRSLLVRTVGQFVMVPFNPPTDPEAASSVLTSYKAALFVAGDKQVDDGFANDPGQFEITSPAVFPVFCRDFAPMHIFWAEYFRVFDNASVTVPERVWHPPGITGHVPWDVTVKRRMQGDEALFLLIDCIFLQSAPQDFGGSIDVETRTLLQD